ncbi:MAG: outer membrane protein assembly factor BamD [Gammaproteobacteria bacterium]|nr:MAG: outer membrane protein assembly factor BamD [Gammaproteobacteria bacterium]
MRKLIPALWLVATLFMAGCSSTPEKVLSEREYYDKAKSAMDARNFLEAARHLEALETHHPFGRYAQQGQLDLIYAKYQALDMPGAALAADRFIRLHPDSPHVDYAYYVKGLAAYYENISLGQKVFPIDVSQRDPGRAREAFSIFSELVTRYPQSVYAPDARQRMQFIKNRLAGYELAAARYYIKREAWLAAAERGKYVVEHFPGTPAVPDALAIMVECYRKLGLREQATDALAVLAGNYPNHRSLNPDLTFRGGEIKPPRRSLGSLFTTSPWSE